MSSTQSLAPVRHAVTVAIPPERAFALFTERIGDWWPLATHSLAGERADGAVLEGRVGGQVYETGGTERHLWANVVEWEPPRRFVLDWQVSPSSAGTEVEVTFTPDADGTRVEVEHRGWERLDGDASASRESYDTGWVEVLDHYAALAS